MLYGDDDTMWFVGGVLDLLKDLDPDMPYVITGGSPRLTCCTCLCNRKLSQESSSSASPDQSGACETHTHECRVKT